MKVRLSAPAKADMVRVWAYYEKRQPGLGDQFLDDLALAIRHVRDFPLSMPVFWKGARRIGLSRFPYAAAYRVDDDIIEIFVIAHLRRDQRVWKKR